MATELVIVHYCDVCIFDGQKTKAVLSVTMAEADAPALSVETCEPHGVALRDAWAIVSRYGAVPDDDAAPQQQHRVRNGAARGPVCPRCQRSYSDRAALRTHLKNVHAMSAQDFVELFPPSRGSGYVASDCPYCEHVGGSKVGLIAHVRSAHPENYASFRETPAGSRDPASHPNSATQTLTNSSNHTMSTN